MLKIAMYAGLLAGAMGLAACNDGSAEKSGEKLDSAIDNATKGEENKSDGALEKAGEAIDKATGETRSNDAADTLNDATDGDPKTRPN